MSAATTALVGVDNVHEFYTDHYLSALVAGDVKPVVQAWTEQERAAREARKEHGKDAPGTGFVSPVRRVSNLQRDFFRRREALRQVRSVGRAVELHAEQAAHLLHALGYERVRTGLVSLPSGSLPVFFEARRPDGSPHLWVVPAPAAPGDADSDPLSRVLLPREDLPDASQDTPPLALDHTIEALATEAFSLPQGAHPRFLLVVGGEQWLLLDRSKWAEQRLLRFDWAEILGRREPDTLAVVTALLHREQLAPHEGSPLVDTLDDRSHKNAFEVSEDLKYALRASIEDLGNEVVDRLAEQNRASKKAWAAGIDGGQLGIECLRFMYRLLFLLYIEARPELGYAPMGSEAYRLGYSFERLRDLETVVDLSEEAGERTTIHAFLDRLFTLVWQGLSPDSGTGSLLAAGRSDHHTFRLAPLRTHLFDPERTPLLAKVQLRDKVLLPVLKRMSLSRARGRSGRTGRISYATLGINQLGAVYEALLSFRGFFATETLYEVKPAKDKHDPLAVAFFVPQSDIARYTREEVVRKPDGEPRSYEPGTFIYRQAGRDRQKSASYYTPQVLTRCLVKYALKELLDDEDGRVKLSAAEILQLTVCEPAMGSAAFLNEAINQLAEAYLRQAQHEQGRRIPHADYAHELQKVRMYMADNNVFGVDLNPVALELAEVSLWLNAIFTRTDAHGLPQVFVPWFGGQLACGNSLVGGWRKVYSRKQLAPGRGKKPRADWLDAVPERVRLAEQRPTGSAWHFLLPDRDMATYGQGSEGRPIKERWGEQLQLIKDWKKEVCTPLDDDELEALDELSEAVDVLWERHTQLLREIRRRTTDPLDVWGQPAPEGRFSPSTTRQKDAIWFGELESAEVRAASPYRRLKLAMDYWCALWFWPIEQAELLPTRDEWLAELALILDMSVLPTLQGEAQKDLFAPTMPADQARALADELGVVDVDRLIERLPRLKLVSELGERYRFHHWELVFSDLFADRGGFDLVVGNPPWIRVEWKEAGVMGDQDPTFVLRKLSAKQAAERREVVLEREGMGSRYLGEHEEAAGTQAFLSCGQNYPDLQGIKVNLYKAFIPLSWAVGTVRGVAGLLHPESIYDDPKGGRLRRVLYPRLRRHYHFRNELGLFEGTNDHGRLIFSLNVTGQAREPEFVSQVNLFTSSTIDESEAHHGQGPIPGIKDQENNWCVVGHRDRVIEVDITSLELFAKLYDDDGTPSLEARLAALHAGTLLGILQQLASAKRLTELDVWQATFHFNETYAQRDGTIRSGTQFIASLEDWIITGPHFFVGQPFYKTPRRVCSAGSHYDVLDLEALPDEYLPRTNYVPACTPEVYAERTPTVPWGDAGNPLPTTSFYRVMVNRGLNIMMERTLQPCIAPREVGHVHGVYTYTFPDEREAVDVAATWAALPVDFFIKTTGAGDFFPNLARRLPVLTNHPLTPFLRARTLALNCLTTHYTDLWRLCWDPAFQSDQWALPHDPRLPTDFYARLTPDWTRTHALRSSYARRMALVELDVLVAMGLGLTLDQLQAMYRIQFPVMQKYERDTWYDTNGRIIFTNNGTGLPGVGLPRSKSKKYPVGPYWKDVADQVEGTVTQVVEDDTLPGGPHEKVIVYEAPWVRCSREEDYAKVWAVFEERLGGLLK